MNEVRRPSVSVVVRARDEAPALQRCLAALHAQQGLSALQVVYVDAGSHDGSPEVAAAGGAEVVTIDAFSFGAGLNRGVERAQHPVIVALSAHAGLTSDHWISHAASTLTQDPQLACVSGDVYGPDGEPLIAPIRQNAALARRRPEWGYANGAGAFRADLWRERRFDPGLPACEDKEWALHWLDRGYRCLIDPALAVSHDHTHDPLRAIYRRARREAEGYAAFTERGPHTTYELITGWWSDLRFYDSPLRARLSPRRAARLLGDHAGRKPAR